MQPFQEFVSLYHMTHNRIMKQTTFFLALALIVISLSSCHKHDCIEGRGSIGSEVLFAPAFDGIRAKGSFNVFIEHGAEQEVRAVGHQNIIDRLQLDLVGDILNIDLQSDCYRDYELAIYITTPSIEKVFLDGSGDIDISPMDNESDLFLEINGSGRIDFDEFAGVNNLDVRIDGSGTVTGFADFPDLIDLNIDIEGSGDYRGFDVITESCEIQISGSGNCQVHVTENLDVVIEGSGSVYYKGDPLITADITGSGEIVDSN